MDQTRRVSNFGPVKRNYQQDRLNRIDAAPYDTSIDSQSSVLSTTSRNFLNYVKGKMFGTVSSLKKLLHNPKPVPWVTLSGNENSVLPSFSDASMRDFSTSVQEIVLKPEHQKNYDMSLSMSDSQKKKSFLDVVDVYKGVAADKLRERMNEKKTSIHPTTVSCSNKPIPLYTPALDEDRLAENKEYKNRKFQKIVSSQGEKSNVNKKRGFASILSLKEEKSRRANKKVTFCPKLERQSSGVIKYTSSDEEEDPVLKRRHPQKQVFAEDKVIRNDPVIKLVLLQSKRSRINPFQKKYLSDKSMMSQSTMSEKAIKKMSNDDYYKADVGKLNHENSFASDNFINDSKLETDSDESNLAQSPNLNILKDIRKYKGRNDSEDLSEEPEKKSRSPSNASSKKFGESPIESQNFLHDEEEEKVQIQETKEQGDPMNSIKSFLFSKGLPKKEEKTSVADPIQPISLFNNPPKLEIAEVEKSSPVSQKNSLFNNISKPSTNITEFTLDKEHSKGSEMIEKPEVQEPVIFANQTAENKVQPVVQESVTSEKKDDAPVVQDTTPAPVLTTQASTAPSFFANYEFKKQESTTSNNPFLRSASTKQMVDITALIGGNSATSNTVVAQQPQSIETQAPVQNIVDQAPVVESKPVLDIFKLIGGGASQSENQDSGLFRSNSMSLKPASTVSWMGNNDNQENKQNNLFGGLASVVPSNSMFSAPSQNQNSLFGNSLGQNNASQGGFGMNLDNNSGAGNTMFGLNNNSNSMFGNNNMGFNSNSGVNMMGEGQSSGSGFTFGGSSYNNNSNGFMGMGTQSNNVTANPFVSSQSVFSSGAANNMGSSQTSGLLSMTGGGSNLFSSGNKKGKPKAFA